MVIVLFTLLFSYCFYYFKLAAHELGSEAREKLLCGQSEDVPPWEITLLASLSPVFPSIAT